MVVVVLTYAIISLQLFSRANHQEMADVAEKNTEEIMLLLANSTVKTTTRTVAAATTNLSVLVPRDSLLWSKNVLNNTELFSLFSTGNVAPVLVAKESVPRYLWKTN